MKTQQTREERREIVMRGWIGLADGERSLCMVFDISQAGATIAVNDTWTVPENFLLYFSPTAQTFRQCVVRWRKEDSVGVQFEKPDPKNLWLL